MKHMSYVNLHEGFKAFECLTMLLCLIDVYNELCLIDVYNEFYL